MAFTVEVKRRALRTVEKLDPKRKKAVGDAILILKEDPVPFRLLDVVTLKGFDSVYRVRLGGLRMVYAVGWSERRILIHYIGPREAAYE
ncbi:MAG: type II toxin-antitoxin system RelE/ParE family toxin [Nitrososphaerota archaeon]|nr:type II toxin-antitoxin system RelE/ParE family toxin [Nitrososphaerota archaeon]MDG6918003.1 type II toxin-antitoxin system RelE/ParE family toxin [Nitrososphaerota archaeon]